MLADYRIACQNLAVKLIFLSRVKSLCKRYAKKTDEELRDISLDLGFEARQYENVSRLLDRGFALVKEMSRRKLGMDHYDVQLMGGRAMCLGHVAEMRTGEGKTLTATLPMFIYSLSGRGALLATTNDYLAKRDAEQMQHRRRDSNRYVARTASSLLQM